MSGPTIRVGLFGFGRAGKAVAEEIIHADEVDLVWVATRTAIHDDSVSKALAMDVPAQGHFVATQSTPVDQLLKQHPVDFIVDFSGAQTVHYYGQAAARAGIGIVSAVSHYGDDELALLRRLGSHTRVLYSPNITVGINFLMLAAKALRRIAPHADVEVIEQHFRDKREVSGTAMRLAQTLDLDSDQQVNSIRVGGIIGKHEVIFGFPYQTIRLVHESIARNAFGQGALYAISRLQGCGPGFRTMEQLMVAEFQRMLSELETAA